MTQITSAAPGPGKKEKKRLDGVLLKRFGVSICEASDLLKLSEWEIIAIVDDSGSMSRKSVPREKRKPGVDYPSRWQELRETLDAMIDIATCLDEDGVDLHFLNLGSVMGVRTIKDQALQDVLAKGPQSGTPLTSTVNRVVRELKQEHNFKEKKYLVVILTDGEPSGGREPFKAAVTQAVQGGNVRFQIMACTGDDSEVEWLNEFDELFDEVDVTDDYDTERGEVMRTGRYKDFTRGDWIVKALLGPIDPRFDAMDEMVEKTSTANKSKACVIL